MWEDDVRAHDGARLEGWSVYLINGRAQAFVLPRGKRWCWQPVDWAADVRERGKATMFAETPTIEEAKDAAERYVWEIP